VFRRDETFEEGVFKNGTVLASLFHEFKLTKTRRKIWGI